MSAASFAHDLKPLAAPKTNAGKVRVNQPGDAHECEADRVADTVSRGGRVQSWSISNVGMVLVQRQPTPTQPPPKPNNYKDGMEKIGEAFLQTDVGKKLVQAVTDDPLVKAGENFIASLPGKIITGATAVGAVAGLAAEHKGLPIKIPEIPLGKIRPSLEGVTVKITYEGPVDHPTQATVVFSYSPSGSKKKPAQTETERNRAETARIAADQDKFRAGMTYKPGTPQAEQQAADQKMSDDYTLHRFGSLPGTGGKPLAAPGLMDKQPDTGLKLPEFHSPFERKSPTLLDKKLELKPMDAATSPTQTKDKKEEVPVQRKAATNSAVMDGGGGVDEMLHSPGMPLDRQTRSFMESRIGFDFSKVKIHADPQAAVAAKGMGALAYTVGGNIVFGAGQYSPETSEGKKLIAHELTHTVQQQNYVPVAKAPLPAKTAHRPRNISLGEAAANLGREQDRRTSSVLGRGTLQFRVPTTTDLKVLFTSGNVPENVLKDRIQLALTRMKEDTKKKLKTTDSVADIMKKVFPSPKVFDEAAYEAAVDVTDRTEVYQNVLDAEAQVTTADKPKLKTVMGDSAKLIDDCVADSTNLQSVFGTKKDIAKAVYGKAKTALNGAISNIDANITTDYNLDDPETGLGGWARFSDQKVHFTAKVVKVTDEAKAKTTIIHESCHLADATVKDKGYYGSPGFEAKTEDEKVTNAAHYEEIPARKLNTSNFKRSDGTFIDFTPGTSSSGAQLTFEEKVKEKAVDNFRRAWDKAVDVDKFIRDIRITEMAGDHAPFKAKETRIREISKLMHLTVHEQPAATATVNQVDVVLAEGVPRAMGKMQGIAKTQTVPNPLALKVAPLQLTPSPGHPSILPQKLQLQPIPGLSTQLIPTVDEAAKQVIEDTIKAFGTLTGTPADDKALVDWLVAEYKKPL